MSTTRAYLTADDRRTMLLDAAGRLFGRGGFDAVTMIAVAREAGVSRALVYQFFPDQTALKLAFFGDRLTRYQHRIDVDAADDADVLERALLAFDALVQLSQADLRALSAVVHAHSGSDLAPIRTQLGDFTMERLVPFLDLPFAPSTVRAGLWLFVEILVSLSLTVVEGEMPLEVARPLFGALLDAAISLEQ
jgi:AcrR family transcriptional regulator